MSVYTYQCFTQQNEDLFGNLGEDDSDADVQDVLEQELKTVQAGNPYSHSQEQDPDYKDTNYYTSLPYADHDIAYYRQMAKLQDENDDVSGEGSGSDASSTDSDFSSDDSDEDEGEDTNNERGKLTNDNVNITNGHKADVAEDQEEYDEYADGDSSDEEEIRNTIGEAC